MNKNLYIPNSKTKLKNYRKNLINNQYFHKNTHSFHNKINQSLSKNRNKIKNQI